MKKFALLFFIAFGLKAYSQGCSDAGFCSISNMMPSTKETKNHELNTLRIGTAMGTTRYKLFVLTYFLEHSLRASKKITLNTRVTAQSQSDKYIQTTGMGDVFFTGDYQFSEYVSSTVGFKIPLSQGDIKYNGASLPMDFQSSLGTFDFLLGIKGRIKNWGMGMGWQVPLTQNNNNYLVSGDLILSQDFSSSNKFYRNSDLWFRGSYTFKFGDYVRLSPNLLPIIHLGNDSYRDENNVIHKLKGSSGLTLNADVQFDWFATDFFIVGLNIAAPIVNRKLIPDGTSRYFVFTGDLRFNF